MWFDPGLAGLFITSTLLHLGEDINLLVVSSGPQPQNLDTTPIITKEQASLTIVLDRFLWSACFNSQVHECAM